MQSNVAVNYNPAKIAKGPLSSIHPLSVTLGEFKDKRPETDKIGYKID
jgi:hypothetical protein